MEQYVVIKDMSAGNDSVGEMWQETKIFNEDATLKEVMKWAQSQQGKDPWDIYSHSKKRITITKPNTE